MSNRVIKDFWGYCPEHKQQMNVEVTFVQVPISGTLTPQYKKFSISCPYFDEDECETCGGCTANCPIFQSAKL